MVNNSIATNNQYQKQVHTTQWRRRRYHNTQPPTIFTILQRSQGYVLHQWPLLLLPHRRPSHSSIRGTDCKSLVFDGSGNMHYTSNIIETPLTTSELTQNKIINRGVMSTVADMNNVWGYIRNALSSSERDTANLTADLWPLPSSSSTKNANGIEPVLIVTTDNGEPYALDPKT